LDNLMCSPCEEFPLVTLSPAAFTTNRVNNIRRNTEIESKNDVDVGFYYDVASAAIAAAK
jgi:hypothetical protein